jgi:hypothetical protein
LYKPHDSKGGQAIQRTMGRQVSKVVNGREGFFEKADMHVFVN